MDDILKTTNDGRQGQHFGEIDFTVYYTLGVGLAERLGDNIEHAVVKAVRTVGGTCDKILFDGVMIRRDVLWHWHPADTTQTKPLCRALSLHLSHDQDDNVSVSRDWEYF